MEEIIVKQIKKLSIAPTTVFNLSVEGNENYFANGVLVHNSPNVILDESSLIDDYTYATVKRMLMDAKGGDSCLIEIGNPFYRGNHFERIGRDPEYKKIFIDWRQAVAEGRFTEKDIEEAKREALFDILYECKFPDQDAMDDEGWSALLVEDDLKKAKERGRDLNGFGEPRLGVDVSRGGACWNAWIVKYSNIAFIRRKDHEKNTMSVAGRTEEIREELKIKAPFVFIDSIGVGAGVVDRLHEQKIGVSAFVGGEKAQNEQRYYNRRAEAYWRLREWVLAGGALSDDEEWDELLDIRYKVASDRRILIMSKDEMAKRGIQSPDCADGLSLCFGTVDFERPTVRMTAEAKELLDMRSQEKNRRRRGSNLMRI